jgi:hypothetical protein
MAEVNDSELTTVENALEMVIQALSDNESPEAMQLKQTCVEAQQIITAKIENAAPGASESTGGPAGQ